VKIFIIFLNVYILVLSFLSCKDKEESVTALSEIRIEASHQSGSTHPEDTCPPFCNCACCGIYKTIPGQPLAIAQPDIIVPVRFSIFKISFPREISLSVWQPPRLV
jgi:hypothetical protein